MACWYKVTIPFEDAGFLGPGKSLRDAFEAMFVVHQTPPDAAMFAEHDAVYQRYIYYFSPGAYAIAGTLIDGNAGITCPRPANSDRLALLVGHAGAPVDLLAVEDKS
jgi:hypothetical protein